MHVAATSGCVAQRYIVKVMSSPALHRFDETMGIARAYLLRDELLLQKQHAQAQDLANSALSLCQEEDRFTESLFSLYDSACKPGMSMQLITQLIHIQF